MIQLERAANESKPHENAVDATVIHGVLDPYVVPAPYAAQELGNLYAQAKIFGRMDIHRTVVELEILRLEQFCEAMLQRKEVLTAEITAIDQRKADAEKRYLVAQSLFRETENLTEQSLARH